MKDDSTSASGSSGDPLVPINPEQRKRLESNWQHVVEDVASACRDAARDPADVTIVGVTKYVDASMTAALHEIGCHHLGENRPQLLWRKAEALAACGKTPQWHQIGQLQTNKVRRLLRHVPIIHTIDRLNLLECVADESRKSELVTPCLIEVNISGDQNKSGLAVDQAASFIAESGLAEFESVRWTGLMGMSGLNSDGRTARDQFAFLRVLRDRLQTDVGVQLPTLSMGMSGDFREAIAEGATIVRIGSRIFEGLMA